MELKLKNNSNLMLSSYTELEYIEGNGLCVINTDIPVSVNTSFLFDLMQKDIFDSSRWLYTFIVGSGESAYGLGWDHSDQATRPFILYPGSTESQFNFPLNERHTIELYYNNGGKIKYDGVLTISNNSGIYIPGNSLFHFNLGGIYPHRYYNVTVKEGNITVLDLIPAKDHNGIVCMYDKVSETFFYNQGTGDFIAGPAVDYNMHPTLLKASSLYHENCPNINGWALLNKIYDWNINNQTEIKYLNYKNSATWQTIITQHPEFETYAEANHQFLITICEQENPINAANQFAANIEQYPALAPLIVQYPALAPLIVQYPALAPIIAENPEVVHSLVDTGKETSLTSSGTQYIDTNFKPSSTSEVQCFFEFTSIAQGNCGSPFASDDGAYTTNGFGLDASGANNELTFAYGNENSSFIQCNINKLYNVIIKNGLQQIKHNDTVIQTRNIQKTFTSNSNLALFACNRNNNVVAFSTIKLLVFKVYNNNDFVRWLAPIENNGNPCMIDLLTGTKYLNQGTGSFTYTLEDRQ